MTEPEKRYSLHDITENQIVLINTLMAWMGGVLKGSSSIQIITCEMAVDICSKMGPEELRALSNKVSAVFVAGLEPKERALYDEFNARMGG